MQTAEPTPRALRDALSVLALACALYFPFLGHSGFAHSEGFRAYPGWEMLDSGDWTVPHLFGQPYLRKPPLVPWLHASFALMFGRSEFVARSVSSTALVLTCLACWWFARRWFGARWALWAGLGAAVMPLAYWYPPGRAAEIEPVHNLLVVLATCQTIDALINTSTRRASRWAQCSWIAFGFGAMLLAKGPAGVPVVMGAILACVFATRRLDRRTLVPLIIALVVGTALFVLWSMAAIARVRELHQEPIYEPASKFLFRSGKYLSVLLLPFAALATALPHSAALVMMPWSRPGGDPRRQVENALAWTVAISLFIYTCVGVSNPRYAWPALALLPLCAAGAAWWTWGGEQRAHNRSSPFARTLLVVLTLVAIGHITWAEHRRATRTSGKPDARRLGEVLRGAPGAGVELWGDQLVDVRPEVLKHACLRAQELGQFVAPRWIPYRGDVDAMLPPAGSYFIVRVDDLARPEGEISERTRMEAALRSLDSVVVFDGRAHNFLYRVYQRM